jgi:ATP-dependent DNA helicase RecQ
LADGDVKLLLTNPETLLQPRVLARLKQQRFDHAALDEAHCFTLWGKDFRPTYRELPAALAELNPARITAFTATASPRVTADWSENLFPGQQWTLIQAPADRANLDFSREKYLSLRLALPRVLRREAKPALIFCRNRDMVRQWAHHLHRETGLDVRFYHAGLSREEKTAIEQWYHGSQDGVLVATNAYGMGVDKKNIRTVVHLDRPDKTEDYLQEAGRGGRDGQPSRAVLLTKARLADVSSAGCWRAELLAVFGETPDACSGCDSCRGQTAALPNELVRCCCALLPHVGRLDEAECRALLKGRALAEAPGLASLAGWALFADWDDLTFSEFWEAVKNGGWISFGKRPRPTNLLRRIHWL